eukprot:279721-Pyramimonas_sp.AAC.1
MLATTLPCLHVAKLQLRGTGRAEGVNNRVPSAARALASPILPSRPRGGCTRRAHLRGLMSMPALIGVIGLIGALPS